MTNKDLFKQAHELTRATIQAGDDYRATFGLCLQSLMIDKRMAEAVYIAINYTDDSKPVAPRKRLVIDWDIVLMIGAIVMLVVLFIAGISAISAMDKRNKASFDALYADDTAQVVTADDSLDDMFNNIQSAIDDSGVSGITIVKQGDKL